ncbi:MAG TPA: DUF362 domain-containing protein [Deltaproteobacteria bacterium]|nr:DUF362 domain-containing protein [Deltaproteobacteria bacterium]
MDGLDRRGFLRLLAGLGLCALGPLPAGAQAAPSRSSSVLSPEKGGDRVVALSSEKLFPWDGRSRPYVDAVEREELDRLVDAGVKRLTGAASARQAWRSLFDYGRGEKVALKPNLNWIKDGFEKVVTSPQLVGSTIRGLVEHVGVRESDIFVYDVSRPIPAAYRERVGYDVRYVQRAVSFSARVYRRIFGDLTSPSQRRVPLSNRVVTDEGVELGCFVPQVVARCDHLVNLPVLKSHQFVLFSGAMKNLFGSVVFDNGDTTPRHMHGAHLEDHIAEVAASMRDVTRLVVCDAMAGTWSDERHGAPERWESFGGGWPSSLFFARCAVAMDGHLRRVVAAERSLRGLELRSSAFVERAKELTGCGKNP